MMPEEKTLPMGRRALRATVWLCFALAVVLTTGLFESLPIGDIVGESEESLVDARALAALQEEAFCLDGCSDVRINDEGSVVGWVEPGSARSVLELRSAELAEKGWTYLSAGDETSATFLKGSGEYQWMFMSCFDVSGEVSVVVQLAV